MIVPHIIHTTYCSELTVVCVEEFEVDLGDVELCGAALAQPLHGDVLAGQWSVTPDIYDFSMRHLMTGFVMKLVSIEQTGNF